MSNHVINVGLGFDQYESEGFLVAAHSIIERCSMPVRIVPICTRQLPLTKPRDRLASNDFARSRFLTPWAFNYEWCIFLDGADMLCRWDLADLWNLRDETMSVQCVKHSYGGWDGEKYLGTRNSALPRKNWSSVMLMNGRMLHHLTPEYVNEAPGKDLHMMTWASGIGDLDKCWNHLVDVYPYDPGARIVHWTHGMPAFAEYQSAEYAEEWRIARGKAFNTKQRA